ncbi:cell envelope integrity protein TolA [Oxalobacteraceae bacterium R-40]|uniref:Cell envelope integrity protein TolA n=1 Tax=Keguizhuia sedimenti TaxID=3064264 RepID=A0ABU1BPK1_9BURK|nr:cell envelope integrity protein TolA [Oxalobacteraceae bacterium R-40]
MLTIREAGRHDFLEDSFVTHGMPQRANLASHCTRRSGYRMLQYVSDFLVGMRFSRVLLAFVLSTTMGLLPSLAYAQLSYWIPCQMSGKAKSEGRTTYIGDYLKAKTVGMKTYDIEDLYCVTRVKCVALGHCKASSPDEQAAANKLKREIAAEESRLQRERQAKAAQAERNRKKAEEDRQREEARRQKLAAAEEKRLRLSAPDAKRLVEAREEARKKMPPQPEKCTSVYPAYTQKLDFTPVVLLQSKAEKDYSSLDRSKMCNGHPGKLGPLECEKPADFFGLKFASCSATKRCPERKETRRCSRASAQ